MVRPMKSLEEEMKENEMSAQCKIIGLTLETRPDRISPQEIIRFRQFGVTRVQIGVQHTNERILRRVNRGCYNRHVIKAIRLLKDNCFKVDIHLMPDLPQPLKEGVDIKKKTFMPEDIDWSVNMLEEDRKMLRTVINNPNFQADQWKVYPCEATDFTNIKIDYENGAYKPYGHQDNTKQWTILHTMLAEELPYVP